jgi:hypothetical protein
MSPCYKGHKSNSERIKRYLNKQEQNQTPRIFLKRFRRGGGGIGEI